MKRILYFLILLFSSIQVFGQGAQVPDSFMISGTAKRYAYVHVPDDYDTTKRYPLILFFHGHGEEGNTLADLPKILNHGTPLLISEGWPMKFINPVDGKFYEFICISPQSDANPGSTSRQQLEYMLPQMIAKYKIDTNRIYLTGLSAGGWTTETYLMFHTGGTPNIAASVPMEGALGFNASYADSLIKTINHMWGFADPDDNIGKGTISYINYQNGKTSGVSRLTEYFDGHCCWDTYYDPNYLEEIGGHAMNIYQWMLQFRSDSLQVNSTYSVSTGTTIDTVSNWIPVGDSTGNETPPPTVNQPPVAYAGPDKSYSSSVSTITLDGSGSSDPDGTIVSYEWAEQGDSINGTITSPSSVSTTVTGLQSGNIYNFQLTVVDDSGTISTDNIAITINSPTPVNQPPVARAGSDVVLPLGTTSFTLDGSSSTDADGEVTSYHWTQILGNTVTIVTPLEAVTDITGLEDNNTYTFRLTITDDSSAIANDGVSISVGEDTTGTVNPPPPDTPFDSTKIDISPDRIFYDPSGKAYYQVNTLKGEDQGRYLFDEQSADPKNGINTPTPTTAPVIVIKGDLFYPLQYVLDLGAVYHITDVYYFDMNNSDSFTVSHGNPGNWTIDSSFVTSNFNSWESIKKVYDARYLKFDLVSGGSRVGEVIIYGTKIDSSAGLTTTPPPDNFYHHSTSTMGELIGTNIYGKTPPDLYENVVGITRKYEDQSWMDTVTTTHNIDSVNFVFDQFMSTSNLYRYRFPDFDSLTSWRRDTNNLTVAIRDAESIGHDYFVTTMNKPQYALNAGWGRPIDSVMHPSMDATDPFSYDRLARLEYNLAGVLGSGNVPDDSLQVSYPLYHNQGVLRYIELGNEQDGDWLPLDAYYTPQMLNAYNSALYDGDNGSIGNRMGVKQADSSVIVSMGAITDIDTTRLKAMYYWAQYTRLDHNFPADVVNVHYYSNDDTLGLPSGDPHGLSPEQDSVRKHMAHLVDVSHQICPPCEVWWTEFGYDRNRRSPQSVPIIPGKDSAQIQAEWLIRTWLAGAAAGLDRQVQYQIWNEDTGSHLDSSGVNQYNTVGLTTNKQDATTFEFDYRAMPAYYYTRGMYQLLHDYKFDSIVRENPGDSIWIYRFRNVNVSDSVIYAIWSPTRTNDTLTTYFKTGHANTDVLKVTMEDKSETGDKITTTSDSNGNTPLTVTENPLFLATTYSSIAMAFDSTTTLNPPACDIEITSISHTDETCENCNDGSITITATSSGPDIEYSLDSITWQTGNTFLALSPETYTIYVKDGNNCTSQTSQTVSEFVPKKTYYIFDTKRNKFYKILK